MLRTRSYIRIGLHGLLVVWMAAVAVAPLWHTGHEASPVPGGVPGHNHGAGAWMCDARPETIDPAVDCVLCQAQRLLSQYWTRVPATTTTSHTAATAASLALFVPRAGERVPVAARAPPLC
jgi:hypothetical protein